MFNSFGEDFQESYIGVLSQTRYTGGVEGIALLFFPSLICHLILFDLNMETPP